MAVNLIVTSPFANRNVGEHIKDEAEISRILDSHHKMHVVRIEVADEPKAEPKAEKPDFKFDPKK